MVSTHAGSCHCDAIRFTVDYDPVELTTCDCSLCVKRNAVMAKVPKAALHIDCGEELLATYQWNSMRAKHHFCRRCGITCSSEACRARSLRSQHLLPGQLRPGFAARARDGGRGDDLGLR
jgi:hypothetical protein